MYQLTREEELMFSLRKLYAEAGYHQYRMNKFEEYDLYARNKDYLPSGQVITFTDPEGRLKALKPDVTLSIVRNYREEAPLQKVWYTENVYRSEHPGEGFREIHQTGLECLGDIQPDQICEVLQLACQSLQCISPDSVLTLSSLDLISTLLNRQNLPDEEREKALQYIRQKNLHELRRVCTGTAGNALLQLLALEGSVEETFELLEGLEYPQDAAAMLRKIRRSLKASGLSDRVRFDFSLVSDLKYYNGIVFKGYVQGIPEEVLSGGQYENLMRRMGHQNAGAIGFAVYLDRAVQATADHCPGVLNIALPKGRLGEKVYRMLAEAGFDCPSIEEENRKLVFENPAKNLRYFWVKPSDVAVYVERGAADLGICGKDILLEHDPDVYELLDLGIGKCRMAVASRENFSDDRSRVLRVATKFRNIASAYYHSLGREIDIIPLNGSIEIAPILGLSDVIVDIVETGTTLRENNLKEFETVIPISARLIANRSAYAFRGESIRKIQEALNQIITGGSIS